MAALICTVSGAAATKLPPRPKNTFAVPATMASRVWPTSCPWARGVRIPNTVSSFVEECRGRALVYAHGPVALDIGVTAYRAKAGAGPADIATQEREVYQVLNILGSADVLGDSHAPHQDCGLGFHVDLRRRFQLGLGQPGLSGDGRPGRLTNIRTQLFKSVRMALDEIDVEDARRICGEGLIIGCDDGLDEALQRRQIAQPNPHLVIGVSRSAWRPGVTISMGILRSHETLQCPLFEGIEHHNPRPSPRGGAQLRQHAGAVGSRILSEDEDGIRQSEVLEQHRALPNADGRRQSLARGLMTEIAAVRKVVGAEFADK